MKGRIGDPLDAARAYFARTGAVAYVVGGRVRDALLGRGTVDTDLAVPDGAAAHARAIASTLGGAFVLLDQERDIARVVWADAILDISRFAAPTLDADLRQRDFTINAMAVPVAEALPPDRAVLLDPTGGIDDLERACVRMTSPAALQADPLRLLRAVRVACELGFSIEPHTRDAVRRLSRLACSPAGERVREEVLRLLASERPDWGVLEMEALGLLEAVLPEIAACRAESQPAPHGRDVLAHTLDVLAHAAALRRTVADDGRPTLPTPMADVVSSRAAALLGHFAAPVGPTSRWTALRLAALLHDVGKPRSRVADPSGRIAYRGHERCGAVEAASVAGRLKLSRAERRYLALVVEGHRRPLELVRSGVTRRAIYRYYDALGAAGVDVALLSMADNASKPAAEEGRQRRVAAVVAALLAAWFDQRLELVSPVPLLSGDDLLRCLRLEPGPAIGRILEALREAQAVGEVTSREQALRLAAKLAESGC